MPVPVFLQNKRIQEQHHNMEIICITVIAVQNCGFRAYGLSTVLFSGVSTTSYLSAHPPGCCRGLPAPPPPPTTSTPPTTLPVHLGTPLLSPDLVDRSTGTSNRTFFSRGVHWPVRYTLPGHYVRTLRLGLLFHTLNTLHDILTVL